MQHYDVLVVGQGIVGAAAALGFHQQGRSVAVVDPSSAPSWSAETHDNRVFAVSPASVQLFKQIGVWGQIAEKRVSPYSHMSVWDEGSAGSLDFSASEVGEESLGYIVENNLLCQSLAAALAPLERFSCAVSSIDSKRADDLLVVVLDDGTELSTKLLLGADGGKSFVRGSLGISVAGKRYTQHGIVATISSEKPHRNTAWQRFLSSGPLAFLPLSDGRSSIVWSAEDEVAERLMALDDASFSRELMIAADGALGAILTVEKRASFPLFVQQADQYVSGNVVLLGDAAHSIHPLAGLGVNLGLGDVAELLDLLQSQDELQSLPASILRRYQRARRSENMKLAAVTDGLDRLFTNSSRSLAALRGFGMKAATSNPFVRKQIIKQALGL